MKKRINLLEPTIKNLSNFDFAYFQNNKLKSPNYFQFAFEDGLKKFLKTDKEVCVLNSGTSALHLSLVLCGIKENDVVFCANSTYIATVNSILYLKAVPIFVDINPNTLSIDNNFLELAIISTIKKGKIPKAIITTHSYGFPSSMDELTKICEKYNLKLIEDAAEALGSSFNDAYCGTIGDYGVLSFNTNKINTTLGGGALIVNNVEEKYEIYRLANQYKNLAYDFKHKKIAYNYRMNDLAAYYGVIQLNFLEEELRIKKNIHKIYEKNLPSIFNNNNSKIISNKWLNIIKLHPFIFQKLNLICQKKNIEIRKVWYPLNLQTFLKSFDFYGEDFSLKMYNSFICLPSSLSLTEKDIYKISNTIKNYKNFN